MNQKYSKIVSTSSSRRAEIRALDNDIKRLEQNMKFNPFAATPENIELKKMELEEKKMVHERDMVDAERAAEEAKINNMFDEED